MSCGRIGDKKEGEKQKAGGGANVPGGGDAPGNGKPAPPDPFQLFEGGRYAEALEPLKIPL